MLAAVLSGCGYQQSGVYDKNINAGYQWHSLYREDIQTVAVPVFVNRSYRRGVEISLTKAIIQQLERTRLIRRLRRSGRILSWKGRLGMPRRLR